MQPLPQASDIDRGDNLSLNQIAADNLVTGIVFPEPDQDQYLNSGIDAADWRQLPHSVANKHKLMQVMLEREGSTQLADRVEIDDAYLGGERTGGKVGRGSENKIPFIAAIETNSQGHPKQAVFTRI